MRGKEYSRDKSYILGIPHSFIQDFLSIYLRPGTVQTTETELKTIIQVTGLNITVILQFKAFKD